MSVPFVDLRRLHEPTRDEMLAAFARVLDSGTFVQGPEGAALEQEFASALGAHHARAVNSGTAALHLALAACGVGPGDEVITVANTFFATAEAISLAGAAPVFIEIDPATFTMDPAAFAQAITRRTKAVVVVHLYGRVAAMEPIMEIAREHGLRVIEDACQAHGARQGGRAAGTIGDAGCFSFYPTKNVGTVGEGGMVVTNDAGIAQRAASLRDHGQAARHNHVEPGYNYRLPELQAAAVRVLLPHMEAWNTRRQEAAERYRLGLAGAPVLAPARARYGEHVYHLFVIRSTAREALQAFLAERGVATAIHYPRPIHLQPAYAPMFETPLALAETERAAAEILSLPMHPCITDGEIDAVCAAIHAFGARPPVEHAEPALTGAHR